MNLARYTIDQNFVYICTGSEGSDFNVTLPTARPDDSYFVTASLAGVATIFSINLPNSLSSDRTSTQFRVVTNAAVHSGDRIEFHVYDPISGDFVDLRAYGLVTDIDDGAIATANGKAISRAFLDRPTNTVFVLPMGRTYVNRDLAGSGIHRFAALNMTALTDV